MMINDYCNALKLPYLRDNHEVLIGEAIKTKQPYEACMKGKTVLFLTIPDLIIRIREHMSMSQIKMLESRFQRYDLIILDEFGYFSFDPEVAEVFFAMWSMRHMKGSTIVTTNLDFDEWVKPLNDAKIAGALVGRLCEKSYVIELEREIDGRLQNTLDWRREKVELV